MDQPPARPEFEQAILGGMILDSPTVLPIVIGKLTKDDFYSDRNRSIYKKIVEMYGKREVVDIHTVGEKLKKQAGVTSDYLAELCDTVAGIGEQTILYYVRELKEATTQRKLQELSLRVQQATQDGKPSLEIIKSLRKDADVLATEVAFDEFKYDSDVLTQIQSELDERINRYDEGQKVTGIKTGFSHLDNLLNGLQPGLYVLGSAPSQGKTTFCKQLADQVALHNKIPVVFVSYEQSKFELIIKSLSRLTGIDSLHLQKGNVSEKESANLVQQTADYHEKIGRYLITIEAEAATDLNKIEAYAMRAMKEHKTDECLVILDYLQVIPYRGGARDRRGQLDETLTGLRRLARRLDCPIWLISSFSRRAYQRGMDREKEKVPDMTSFKESGNIEYTADVAILVNRRKEEPVAGAGYDPDKRDLSLRIIKNRNGLTGKIDFVFRPALSAFEEEGGREELEEQYLI